jgi:MFS family permease
MSVPLRLGLVNLFHYLSMMASVIFLPLYASELGASNLQVGLIVAAYGMAYFLSSLLFGRLSDVHGRLVLIRVGLVLSAIAFPLQLVAASPLSLLAVRGTIGFCLGMSSAALAAYVYEEGGRIGSFASYGALGWLLAALAGALIGDFEGMFILSAASSFLALVLTLGIAEHRQEHVRVSALPVGVI